MVETAVVNASPWRESGLRWRLYDTSLAPLGGLSLEKTKTGVPRRVPVHPTNTVRAKIERDLRTVEAGREVHQYEAKRRMARWLGQAKQSPLDAGKSTLDPSFPC